MAIDKTLAGREFDRFVESPSRAGKTAVEVVGTIGDGPFQPPSSTDFVSSVFSSGVQTIVYKSGGISGTVLKTITITYTGCDFVAVIS